MCSRTGSANPANRRKVCVIEAGPSGLISVKLVAEHLDEFEPIAFERNSDVGGLCIYTDNTDFDEYGLPVHSSVYQNLRTNTPKETMTCPDYPNYEGSEQSCVKHDTVVDYQKNYAKHFNLRQIIQKLTPILNDGDCQITKWHVETCDLKNNVINARELCDIVIICAGQFYKPMTPEILGIDKYSDRVLHSHSYRKPEEFTNQTVTLLGAGVSGRHLSFDLSNHIQKEMPSNIIQVPGVVQADSDGFILSDGSKIQSDSFVYGTAYIHDLPFLNPSSGVEVHERYLYPLYKQVINIKNPTMGFLGLVPSFKAFCPKFYAKAKYYITFLQGKLELLNREKMIEDAEAMMPDKLEEIDEDWHWDYVDEVAQEDQFDQLPDFYRRGVTLCRDFRASNWLHFKEYNLQVLDDGSVTVVKSKSTAVE